MKTKFRTVAALIAASAAFAAATPSQAQTLDSKMFVELKDATLYDALEMVFRAAGNPSHVIDPMAKAANVGSISFENKDWQDVIRMLANNSGFRVRKDGDTFRIEPKPVANPGGPGFPGGFPGAFPGGPPGGFPGAPGTPFGGVTTFGNRQVAPPAATENAAVNAETASVETRISAQTLPGGRRQGGAGGNTNFYSSGGTWRILPLNHSYAGGIAFLFEEAYVLTTMDFVVPQIAMEGGITGFLGERSETPELEFSTDIDIDTNNLGGNNNTGGR
jgi:hypothetical protein